MGCSPRVDLREDRRDAMVNIIKNDLVCYVLPDHGDVHTMPGLRQAEITRADNCVPRHVIGVQGQAHHLSILTRAQDTIQNDVDGGLSR